MLVRFYSCQKNEQPNLAPEPTFAPPGDSRRSPSLPSLMEERAWGEEALIGSLSCRAEAMTLPAD